MMKEFDVLKLVSNVIQNVMLDTTYLIAYASILCLECIGNKSTNSCAIEAEDQDGKCELHFIAFMDKHMNIQSPNRGEEFNQVTFGEYIFRPFLILNNAILSQRPADPLARAG
jgi:hypothetical protein